jgi:hypothetical protein
MSLSSGWRRPFIWILLATLVMGSLVIFNLNNTGVEAALAYNAPTTVTAGGSFQFTIDASDNDLLLEAKYPGVKINWLFEPDEKGENSWIFELKSPFAGTNITLRTVVWGEVDGEKVLEPESEWITIEVTGWVDEDEDGLSDTWEELYELDTDDPNEDDDEDGIIHLEEMYYLTDPKREDSDGDSMGDGWEIFNGIIPFKDDPNSDPDRDSWSNIQEIVDDTDPRDPMSHPKEPRVTPWYWILIIFGVLFLILGYFVKQLFSKKKLEDDLDDFDRTASKSPSGKDRGISGKI